MPAGCALFPQPFCDSADYVVSLQSDYQQDASFHQIICEIVPASIDSLQTGIDNCAVHQVTSEASDC